MKKLPHPILQPWIRQEYKNLVLHFFF